MMEKLEKLGERLRPNREEDGEQSNQSKGLRWYHKAFVVPALALAMFAAASVAAPDAAQAHAYQWFDWYGTFGHGWCQWAHYHIDDSMGRVGCMTHDQGWNMWFWYPANAYGDLTGHVAYWNGYQWVWIA